MALEWVTFIAADEIAPGEREVFETDYGSILLMNIDGKFYAVENMCSHAEFELSTGEMSGCKIECPKHGAWFDVRSGEPLSPPADRPITIYAARVEGDDVQVMLNLDD
ncbi:MAG: non-heme iron oxygenase ferredoxin subunit [Chloroflexota bacterium]